MAARIAVLARRVPPGAWALVAAAALLVPGLGRFGLWEPWESDLAMPAAGAARPFAFLPALGLRLIGGEAGLRAPFVVLALAAALAVYWAASGLHGRRAALLAVAVLLGFPAFTLQARQLTSEMPLVLGLALAIGGLARLAWPARPGPVTGALLATAAGLGLGLYAGGALVGVLAPCAAFAAAAWLDPPARVRRPLMGATVGASVLVGAALLLRPHAAGVPSLLLGGVPHLEASAETFESLIKQAGFGLFPWGPLGLFVLGRAGFSEAPAASRGGLFLLLSATLVLVLSTVRAHLVGEVRFVALAPVALGLGAFLDEALADGSELSAERLLAFLAAMGTVVIARDLYLFPEELAAVHTLGKVRWPVEVGGSGLFLGAGLAFAAAITVGLTTRHRAGILAAVGLSLALSALLTHWIVPALSRHLSRKAAVDLYRRAATHGEPLARFRVEGQAAAAWNAAPGPVLPTREAVVEHLRRPGRAFVLVGAEELASVDEAIKVAGGHYGVLDASSRLLLLASTLLPGEEDHNPLARNVWMAPDPASPARPPWPAPRVTTSAVFGGAVELVGADFPPLVRRPGSLRLVLVFRVLQRPPPGYGIFVHLEQSGSFINGDHQPLGGVLPTARWLPGEYIRDEHVLELPPDVTAAPTYRLLVGFWPGGNRKRLPITAGANDGTDRCPLGEVTVR
jgi:4-amino-4-deoxy-L-arabinose transferase-like glycosyltransferase